MKTTSKKYLYKTAVVKKDVFSSFSGQCIGIDKYNETTGMYIGQVKEYRFGIHETSLEGFVL